ncbi:MAG: ROK family protein [Patescibacteria group bacterium]|nr:ROK family protein [Patescibacteria group bacterium]
MSYLLFDLGATNLRMAAVSEADWSKGELGEKKMVAHSGGTEPTLTIMQQLMEELKPADGYSLMAGGITRKLSALVPELTQAAGRPLYLENDAALVGLGEALTGAGRGHGIVAYVTVSSGVGGVRIVDGMIDRKAVGFEPGYQVINYDGEPKVLEQIVSGFGIKERLGKDPSTIEDDKFWLEMSQVLAYGLYNMILHWSPEVVVVGGAMMGSPGIILGEVKKTLADINRLPSLPEIVPAELGEWGGLHGAAAYLRHELEDQVEEE